VDARGRRSWRSSFLGDPGSKFLCGNWERQQERKRAYKKKKRDGIQTAELNRRDQVTAPNSWPSFGRKTGAKVDYQVAAPTVWGTPTMHRATIAQQRVRMEGWRQRRPGSNAKESTGRKEKTERKNTLTRKKKKNILDTHRPSHGRSWATAITFQSRYPAGILTP
jgi:hypothetical protein